MSGSYPAPHPEDLQGHVPSVYKASVLLCGCSLGVPPFPVEGWVAQGDQMRWVLLSPDLLPSLPVFYWGPSGLVPRHLSPGGQP